MGAIIAAVVTIGAVIALLIRRMLRAGERDYPEDPPA
jgi:hypothetical protein